MTLPIDKTKINEYREKLSKSKLGKPIWCEGLTKETDIRLLRQRQKLKNRKFSQEHKENLSKSLKGLRRSPNTEFKKGTKLENLRTNITSQVEIINGAVSAGIFF